MATLKQNGKRRRCHLHPHREQPHTECLGPSTPLSYLGGPVCAQDVPPHHFPPFHKKTSPGPTESFWQGRKPSCEMGHAPPSQADMVVSFMAWKRAKRPNAWLAKERVGTTQLQTAPNAKFQSQLCCERDFLKVSKYSLTLNSFLSGVFFLFFSQDQGTNTPEDLGFPRGPGLPQRTWASPALAQSEG